MFYRNAVVRADVSLSFRPLRVLIIRRTDKSSGNFIVRTERNEGKRSDSIVPKFLRSDEPFGQNPAG